MLLHTSTFVDMETKVIRIRKEDYIKLKAMGEDQRRKLVDVIANILEDRKESVRPNPPKEKKPVHPSFQQMKEIYTNHWSLNNGFEYQWNGAIDAGALNRLIKSLGNINESQLSVVDFFNVIMSKLPQYYEDKTINAINKNLNGIIATIKNGGNKGNKIQDGGIYDHRN